MLIKECDGVLKASQVDLGSAGSHSIQLYIKDPVHHDDRVLGAAGCCALDNSKHGIIYRTSDTKSQVAAGLAEKGFLHPTQDQIENYLADLTWTCTEFGTDYCPLSAESL